MKKKASILVLFLILGVVGISGCTDKASPTNHFDNKKIAFDYPTGLNVTRDGSEDMWTLTVGDKYVPLCTISYIKYGWRINSIDQYIKENGKDAQINKTTIAGKPAYSIVYNYASGTAYSTLIDMGKGYLTITPSVDTTAKNQQETEDYKVYTTILNSLKIY
ncbi:MULTISPECIES: hypothetical protein [Methanobacterium]|uniref:Uncharacterized protein n=1 Tax=Methanobacterium veterum TaxID=408577 RepID=A0A9E5DLM5_9EURY|nr:MULTISPECIES: hypothetical protein [Methanobacterium]MCZ3367069.1 hypothetical protein [Methanobacterium veterum]MCZ3373784.1 hypothetical protein [Methanobacterium veterum]